MPRGGGPGRGGRRTADEERKLMDLLSKSYAYLCNNFESFKQETRVHIALELIKRRMPLIVNSQSTVTVKVQEADLAERREFFAGLN